MTSSVSRGMNRLLLMPENHLHWTSSEGVSVVTLNRPESRNALSFDLRTSLQQTIIQLDRESEVGALVLTGADPAFCAGSICESLTILIEPTTSPDRESRFSSGRPRSLEPSTVPPTPVD